MIKHNFSDTFYRQCEQYHKEIIDKLGLIGKIMKEANEECCRILCKTPQGHKRNLQKAQEYAIKVKKLGSQKPLDKYIISLLD